MNCRKHIFSIFIVFLLCFFSINSYAFTRIEGNPKWSFKSMPVGWTLNANCSADLSFEACEQAMKDSFDTWTNVSCSTMIWRYTGTTTELDATSNDVFSWNIDGVNLMVWKENGWPSELQGAIAVTLPIHTAGVFKDTDIIFNGYHFTWGVNGEWQKMDVAQIATHEIGHAVGLDHSDISAATMYYATNTGMTNARDLHQDDINGMCSIYPAGDATAEVGIACNTICEEDTDFFCGWFRGKEMCTTNCNTEADCPDGFICGYLNSAGNTCWYEGTLEFGDECEEDWDCKKGLYCRKNEDTQICTELCPASCPDGFSCSEVNGDDVACMPTVNGFMGICDPELCENGYKCYEVADGNYCTKSCVTPLDCPENTVCSNWYGNNICWSEENPTQAELTSFTVDKTEAQLFDTITFKAEATSPNQAMYQFLHKAPGRDFFVAREYGTNNEYEWWVKDLGQHVFMVYALDAKSEAEYDDMKQIIVNVVEGMVQPEDGDNTGIEDGDTSEDGDSTGGSGSNSSGGCNTSGSDLPAFILLFSLLLIGIRKKFTV